MGGRIRPSVTVTSRVNETLHWAYLGFAIQSAQKRLSSQHPPYIPAHRSVLEAIRYSYDYLDASAEFAYALVTDGADGDTRPQNWLSRYTDRQWTSLALGDKLGLLSFSASNEGFWVHEGQRLLFEELKNVRNALTHPGIFSIETERQYWDLESTADPVGSRTTVHGKLRLRKNAVAEFSSAASELGTQDGRKAVEIALLHAVRLDQLFRRPGGSLFGPANPRTGKVRDPSRVLSGMNPRFFDSSWNIDIRDNHAVK